MTKLRIKRRYYRTTSSLRNFDYTVELNFAQNTYLKAPLQSFALFILFRNVFLYPELDFLGLFCFQYGLIPCRSVNNGSFFVAIEFFSIISFIIDIETISKICNSKRFAHDINVFRENLHENGQPPMKTFRAFFQFSQLIETLYYTYKTYFWRCFLFSKFPRSFRVRCFITTRVIFRKLGK